MEKKAIVNDLITLLSSSDDLVRTGACKSLIAIGGPAVPSLVEALKSSNHLVRWEAAKALGEIGNPTAAPALVEALEDEEFEVRWRAAEGLTRMDVSGLKPLLQALMRDGNSVFLREGAHHVLHKVARQELKNCLLPVLTVLESRWPAFGLAKAAVSAAERLEEFQNTRGEMESASAKESIATISNQPGDLGARRRAQRYAKSLRYRA